MCDLYSTEHGYICNECFDELVATGPTTDIKTFMYSEKSPNQEDQAIARYNAEFKSRDEFENNTY